MTTSQWSAISARIVAQMLTISQIGKVWDRKRLAKTQDEIAEIAFAQIEGEQKLRTWNVTCPRMPTSKREDQGGALYWERTALIEGWSQLEDPNDSENDFAGIVEQVIRTIATDEWQTRLGGTILAGTPPKLMKFEPIFYGFVVCHYARLEAVLSTIEG